MTKLLANRAVQYPLLAEFTFNAADTMVMTDGVEKAFSALAPVADVINLPDNAVVIGGELVVETAFNTSGANTATLAVGDSGSASRYLAATNLKAAGRTALVPTGYRGTGENLRITLANQAADATVGKATVRVQYILPGRAHEVQPS